MKPMGIKVTVLFLLGILKQVQFPGPVHHMRKHKVVEFVRDFLRSSSPTSLLKQGWLEQVAQEYTGSIHTSRMPQEWTWEQCHGPQSTGLQSTTIMLTAPWVAMSEAKTIYQPSGHHNSSTVDSSVINDANKVCMIKGPNSLKPLPPHPGSSSAPQHTTAGRGDGALQHMGHFYLLMFLFSFLPKVLVCCTSSEWAAHRRKDLHLQRRVFT